MSVDRRFLTAEGPEIFTGNELLLKGALEAEGGVHLLGGYPGSPIAGFFDALPQIKDLLIAKGIRAVINNNEALAAAMLNGSQLTGCRGMIVIKSVGVHVAADALALGNLAGASTDGGAIVVYGDDPWSDSTQVPADSRYISRHLFIPVIEPAGPQEVKDFVDLSFKLSAGSELYAGLVLTNNLADGGGSVQCRANQYPRLSTRRQKALETALIDLDKYVLLPPRTWWQEESLPDRHERACRLARELGLNRILHPAGGSKPIGFVTSGLAAGYLVQALGDLGLGGEYPILKFGMSYPVDGELVRRLAEQCDRIVVVEERRGFMEGQIAEVLVRERQAGRPGGRAELWGKQFPDGLEGIPAARGLHPSMIAERLVPLLRHVAGAPATVSLNGSEEALDRELATIASTARAERALASLPPRVATFCPGCPHRDSANVCLEIRKRFMDAEYMRRVHGREPTDLVFHGDTGCYTMLMFPPNTELMHDYSGMGLGAGTGSGVDPFVTNKQVVFMGDSTFFHSGQIAIGQAVKLGQDITFIILDNRTTAMTGHQTTPGLDYDVLGRATPIQSIDDVVRGIASESDVLVVRTDPEKRKEYRRLLEEAFLADGVKVVIPDKECGITRGRRKRRAERATRRRLGYLPRREHTNINSEICRFCLACAEMTGCPGLKHVGSDYGPKMDTDLTWCVADGACERVGACSAFERVVVKRKRPSRSRVPELGLDEIPEPPRRPRGARPGWRCCLVGVGSQGIGVATSILVRAGHKEGYQVLFIDKRGLAIRNGSVTSQIVYNTSGEPTTGVIPYGKCDLLIGIDVLEATRALDPAGRARIASAERTAAVINTDKFGTISGIMGGDDFDIDALERVIRAHTRADDYMARNISRICEKYLGSKIYANIMMLGFAFQKGLIPVSMHSMAWAIKDTIRAEFRQNLYAFNMGRKLVMKADLFRGAPRRTGWRETLEEKCRFTIRRYGGGTGMADALRELALETVAAVDMLDEPLKRAIVVRMYDCMRWGGLEYARRYADQVASIYDRDGLEKDYAATRAVVHNLAEAMLIKDPIFIAELATSPEKRAGDREKYDVNPAIGDRISYRHLLHPEVRLGSRTFRLDVAAPSWALSLLKRMRFLRNLSPAWNRSSTRALARYEAAVKAFDGTTDESYARDLGPLTSARCIDCMNPRCGLSGCPLGADIPEWIELAEGGRWREACQKLHEKNNFPEFTSTICPAPCQDACKQAYGGYPVRIRDLEGRIVSRAFRAGWITPRPAASRTGRRVAIVGSGPAGLAAAQQLARAGHDVTVFEQDDRPGGLLRYGVPDFRLDKQTIDRRVGQLTAEGVTFRTGVAVGRDVTAAQLRDEYDAVCLALGASRPRDLDVPGRQYEGIHFALDYLRGRNGLQAGAAAPAGAIRAAGKVVAVIGGGETGNDCVETAVLEGAAEVHQFEILPQGETAAAPADDGVDRRWCVATRAFASNGGRVAALEAVQVHWHQGTGGPVMRAVDGTQFNQEADLVLLALGYDPHVPADLLQQLGLDADRDGRIAVTDCATSVEGVFAAGDLVTGASLVAGAIATGRRAAERIDRYLAEVAEPDAAK